MAPPNPYGKTWQTKIRPYILNEDPRYDGHCEVPTKSGRRCGKPANAVDHIIPLHAGGTNALENLRPACTSCNSTRTPLISTGTVGTLVVIVGAPCSGKSTYARNHAKPEDLIIDHDLIAKALTPTGKEHDHGIYATRVAQISRRAAIDLILKWRPAGTTTWLIHGDPTPAMIKRYDEAGAQFHLMTTTQNECLTRARTERPPRWKRLIAAWYAEPPTLPAGNADNQRIHW